MRLGIALAVLLLAGCVQNGADIRADQMEIYKQRYMREVATPVCTAEAAQKTEIAPCAEVLWSDYYAENFATINAAVDRNTQDEYNAQAQLVRANTARVQNTLGTMAGPRPVNCYTTGTARSGYSSTCY